MVLRRFGDIPTQKPTFKKSDDYRNVCASLGTPIHLYNKYFLTKIMTTEVSYLGFFLIFSVMICKNQISNRLISVYAISAILRYKTAANLVEDVNTEPMLQ